jgi:uncharacterized membrane protein
MRTQTQGKKTVALIIVFCLNSLRSCVGIFKPHRSSSIKSSYISVAFVFQKVILHFIAGLKLFLTEEFLIHEINIS